MGSEMCIRDRDNDGDDDEVELTSKADNKAGSGGAFRRARQTVLSV